MRVMVSTHVNSKRASLAAGGRRDSRGRSRHGVIASRRSHRARSTQSRLIELQTELDTQTVRRAHVLRLRHRLARHESVMLKLRFSIA